MLIEKAREFVHKPTILTLKRYDRIRVEWNDTLDKRNKGMITNEDASTICESLLKETNDVEVKFDNKKDFIEFTNILVGFGMFKTENIPKVSLSIDHEIEHSIPWQKAGITSYFGWHSFCEPLMYKPFHLPFGEKYDKLLPLEIIKLFYKSLKAVSIPSESDRYEINRLEKEYGDQLTN